MIGLLDRMKEEELVETFVAGCADLLGVAFIIGISRGITVLMNDGGITDTILHWGEDALAGAGPISFVLLVFLIYLPLTVLHPLLLRSCHAVGAASWRLWVSSRG